ncbi:MAG: hypothetical protein J5716_05450, partial [Alphaproteobacteria bacterium]|nr:hypothetical protein [Alphaproteobacteria bacterium]
PFEFKVYPGLHTLQKDGEELHVAQFESQPGETHPFNAVLQTFVPGHIDKHPLYLNSYPGRHCLQLPFLSQVAQLATEQE